MTRSALVAIVAVVAVNLAILAGARLDRSSDDVQFLTLDERELRLVPQDDGSSALELRLAVQASERMSTGPDPTSLQPSWIGQDALTRLGFTCDIWPADPRASSHYRAQLARGAYIAFDLGTDAWQARLADWSARVRAHAEAERDARLTDATSAADVASAIATASSRASRLVPIEVAADGAALRAKHRARQATLILPVVVDVTFLDGSGTHERAEVRGWVRDVYPRVIPVPAHLRAVFAGLPEPSGPAARVAAAGGLTHPPRYDVTLAIGPALRPWVVDARRLGPPGDR